jgi:site-specific DNA-methyltransferase (cytosine-N4-specific)
MKAQFEWHRYKYFPYEQKLAYRELKVLTGGKPRTTRVGLSVAVPRNWRKIATRTTYFSRAIAETGESVIPSQTLLELGTALRDGAAKKEEIGLQLRRQSTRYSAHGIHEYRGKFNPQIVHAIGNILSLQEGDWVLDPFCGCGTTLLEASHNGWNSIGVDLNPLGVLIARAKIVSMRISPIVLSTSAAEIRDSLSGRTKATTSAESSLDRESREYLSKWFPRSVLTQLFRILDSIGELKSEQARLIFEVVLSDILRDVSQQDPSDLRIRRRKTPIPNTDVISIYLNTLAKRLESIVAARRFVKRVLTVQDALYGDSRECSLLVRSRLKLRPNLRFDAAITSPPYATALPYIDTQRLSLILLGLKKPAELHTTVRALIGNREIGERERSDLEAKLRDNPTQLPEQSIRICRELLGALDSHSDGFRRKNVPALLYKYLCDMSMVFGQVQQLLRTEGPFALVVGRNRTRLGGKEHVIDTPRLLAEIAEQVGYTVDLFEELDTYQRYDRHKLNSITSETLLVLRSGKQ